MKITTKRFDEATTVLYKAFNKGTLDAYDCTHCAVGNLVGHGDWVMHTECGVCLLSTMHYDKYNPPMHKDYSEKELLTIEYIFLKVHNDTLIDDDDKSRKELQFKGLMAVIDYLAELDEIEVPQVTVEKFEGVLI